MHRYVVSLSLAALAFGSLAATPAFALDDCTTMLMPAAQLKQFARGFTGYHSGVDLTAPYGSLVRAAAAGTVVYTGFYFGYGNMVDLRHADGTVTRYAQLSTYAPGLRVGSQVGTGGALGNVGTSGRAHGPHLHFEVRIGGHAVDPKPYLGLGVTTARCFGTGQSDRIEEAHAPIDARPGGLLQ